MRWVRSYTGSREETLEHAGWGPGGLPRRLADGPPRGVILDPGHCDPVFITGYNYYPLLAGLGDDVTIIEWDMALSWEDRQAWEAHVTAAPGLVQVAPYRQYYGWCKPDGAQWGFVHRQADRPLAGGPGAGGDAECDYFGFGLVYLPLWIIRALVADCEDPDAAARRGSHLGVVLAGRYITDVTFSVWHREVTGHRVPVRWDVRPVHLHYGV
jgi:hypothetical protein